MVGSTINQFKNIINKRPVILMFHGKSIEGLEHMITNLKDMDICYASLNFFNMLEEHILSKIDKHLDYILDCSTVEEEIKYNARNRLIRLEEFLKRKDNNLWIVNKGLFKDLYINEMHEKFIYRVIEKTFIVEQLGIDYKKLLVTNSFQILIFATILGGASKIALCGLDGIDPNTETESVYSTYYKPEVYKAIRIASQGHDGPSKIRHDVKVLQRVEYKLMEVFKESFPDIEIPPIVNFSTNSVYNIFDKKPYEKLEQWIKEK